MTFLLGCKNDPSYLSPEMNEFEKAYFEDYDIPEKKWGYINHSGEMVIDNIYDDCRDFMDGLALVNLNGKWGYINTSGNTIIPHQFVEASSFSDGLALVKDFNGDQYFIDKEGNQQFEFSGTIVQEFQFGLSIFQEGTMYGALDTKGEISIQPKFSKLKVLNKDHVVAKSGEKSVLLNHQGVKINKLNFDKIYYEGKLPYVIKDDSKYYVLNQDFLKIEIQFDKIEAFHGDFSLAKDDNKYFLIGKNAETIKELKYNQIEYAGEGHWKYKMNDKWGLLDENGNILTAPIYYLLNRYKDGLLVFGENEDSWGYLNANGEISIAAEYPLVWDYHNGYARVITRSGFGFIDNTGKIHVKAKYFELRDFNDGLARAQLFR